MPYALPNWGGDTQAALTKAKLGTIDFYVAPRFSLYTAANVWEYLGRTLPGTYKNSFSKKFYDVMTGVPETAKESFVIGMDAKLEISIMEPTSRAYNLANGSTESIPGYGTVPVTNTIVTASTTNTVKFTASITGFAVGNEIEVPTGAGTTKEYTYIIGFSTLDVYVYPVLAGVPFTGGTVKIVQSWEFGMGGSLIDRVAIRAIFNATNDGSQICTWAPDARSEGVKDDFKDNKSQMELPMSFMMYGAKDANFTGPIVAKKYLLTAAAAIIPD